jgi:uncharacterized protein YoxC
MAASPDRPADAARERRSRAHRLRQAIVRFVALLTCFIGLVGLGGSTLIYRQVNVIERASQNQIRQISNNFVLVANTLTTVSTSANNASTSVEQARRSLDDAATTTRGAATTFDQTAVAINFAIPGTTYRPLVGVDTNFREQARQLRTLADDVDQTNAAIGQNVQDLGAISRDVGTISSQMADVANQLQQLSGADNSPLTLVAGSARLLLIWSMIIHGLLFALGLCLWLLTVEEHAPTTIIIEEDVPIGR